MSSQLSIPITRQEKERLSRLALRYGLSLPEFSRHILRELATKTVGFWRRGGSRATNEVAQVPEESFEDYERPRALKASFARALKDWQMGRTRSRL
jgi:hypothetical protein